MKVSDIMTKKVKTVDKDELVSKAFGLMKKHNLINIPVVSDGMLAGMITMKDILSQPRYGTDVKVSRIMFKPPTLSKDDDILEVIRKITETGVTAIPVIEDSELVGIVSDHDVLKVMKKEFEDVFVSHLMKDNVPLLKMDDPVGKATRLMDYHKLTTLPVVGSKGILAGVIDDYCILNMFYKPREKSGAKTAENLASGKGIKINPLSSPISEAMSKVYETIKPHDKVSKALKIMLRRDVNTLIVVNDSKVPIGVLERKKLIKYLYKKMGPKGVFLTFSGLKLDYPTNQLLTKVLRDHLLRVQYLATGLTEVKVYIKPVHEGGGVRKHELSVTIYQKGGGVQRVKKIGYDLRDVFDDALTDLERLIMKDYKRKPRVL